MWATLDGPIRFRTPTAADASLINGLDEIDTTTIERHFTLLGDVIVEDHAKSQALRLFVDRSETILADISAGKPYANLGLESYTLTDEFVTNKWSGMGRDVMARPPFAHHQFVPPATSMDDSLSKHREMFRGHESRLVLIRTLEEAKAQFEQFAARMRHWRMTQDPDELLVADLRAALGEEEFARTGTFWMKRFVKKRTRLPVAHLRTNRNDLRN